MTATLWFIGVSTGRSLINAAFPVWMRDPGRDIRLGGHDLPPGSPPESYRALVAGLRADPGALGAVITTHKVAVARAAGDLIDSLDSLAAECGEINSILRTPNRLAGFARDPLSVGRATGLGKDRPGSPLTAEAGFPPGAVVWELNYRGDLALLRQARGRGVEAYDGWNLFCHGWAAALGPILDLPDEAATARRFGQLAAPLRP